jgi:NAD(P)H-dependent flavin oxidoreductase YrpB (nitropropane dioxygenase family)
MCDLVAELKPNVVSFHFGLPEKKLLGRIRATGAKILSSATTVEEAHGCKQRDATPSLLRVSKLADIVACF